MTKPSEHEAAHSLSEAADQARKRRERQGRAGAARTRARRYALARGCRGAWRAVRVGYRLARLHHGGGVQVSPRAHWLLWALVLGLWLLSLWPWASLERDDTDPPNGRSGMHLYRDHATGCEYVGGKNGGITPRIDNQGHHMCQKDK